MINPTNTFLLFITIPFVAWGASPQLPNQSTWGFRLGTALGYLVSSDRAALQNALLDGSFDKMGLEEQEDLMNKGLKHVVKKCSEEDPQNRLTQLHGLLLYAQEKQVPLNAVTRRLISDKICGTYDKCNAILALLENGRQPVINGHRASVGHSAPDAYPQECQPLSGRNNVKGSNENKEDVVQLPEDRVCVNVSRNLPREIGHGHDDQRTPKQLGRRRSR